MQRKDIDVAVLRIEGTNCEEESYLAWRRLGARSEKVHLKQLKGEDVIEEEKRNLRDYHILMIPGGFSAGDYIRAGAIFGARLKSVIGDEIRDFVKDGKPILGVCNGFQVLVEMGLLPSLEGGIMSDVPKAILAPNDSNRFECRPTVLRVEENRRCVFTRMFEKKEKVLFPSAHAEGKFVVEQEEYLRSMERDDQIVFRYTTPDERPTEYPWNPNGSMSDIAGVCNDRGNVLGLMPHPERVFDRYTNPDWTRGGSSVMRGDGRLLFESALDYVEKEF